MTNLQAALGVAQLEKIEHFIGIKRRNAKLYSEGLSQFKLLQLPIEKEYAENVYWMYGIVLADDLGIDADEVSREMLSRKIDTRAFFLGLHEQPALNKLNLFNGETYPVTERISRKGFYLPSGLQITEIQQQAVCQALRDILT